VVARSPFLRAYAAVAAADVVLAAGGKRRTARRLTKPALMPLLMAHVATSDDGDGTKPLVLAGLGLSCAGDLKGEAQKQALATLDPLAEEALKLPGLLADDRSGIYETLVDLRDEAGDAAGKKALAARWLAFLEGEAARASSVEQRAAFDPHRLNAALALGEPLRAEKALQQSERDLPGDYNPPARLAIVYRAAKRWDDALAAVDRALGKVYGPRAMRLYDLKADVQLQKGDRAGAKKTLVGALAAAKALPVEQRRAQNVAAIEKKLATVQ